MFGKKKDEKAPLPSHPRELRLDANSNLLTNFDTLAINETDYAIIQEKEDGTVLFRGFARISIAGAWPFQMKGWVNGDSET